MAASRTIVMLILVVGLLPWLSFGCSFFRGDEIPQLGYIAKMPEPGSAPECYELASLFANQAALRINPYKPPSLPAGEYCDVTLHDVGGNHNDVSLVWNWQGIQIVVRQHGGLGLATPNNKTIQLAEKLVEITKTKYPSADVKRVKAFANPIFGP